MDAETERLRARVAALEDLCAWMYQFAGEVGAPVPVLDALWAAQTGKAFAGSDQLPRVLAGDCEAVQEARRGVSEPR
jgi:hypothetical protein